MTSSDGGTKGKRDSALSDTVADDIPRRRAPRLSLPSYEVGDTLGAGGMGEVLLAHDPKIGRDVAIKRMRHAAPSPEQVERFLREAKIQARLDHPAIVPVHELGHDTEGRPYFTMKRLAGTTLYDLIGVAETSQQHMLRAFVDVCLAIELAHAKGVIHRDLKPTNIMLGDYGEVYVLDWGVARVVGDLEGTAGAPGDIATFDGGTPTQAGVVLGTPGYMAPEQLAGDKSVGPPADVYALGAILFEILAREPLHPRGEGAAGSTLATPAQSPASRKPERGIAPELDAACVAALAPVPGARPSARGLGERVQRYLDGDRDLERRRELAREQLERAKEAAAVPERRAEAMRAAGRALALDPESEHAGALVGRLLLEPPERLAPELEHHLEEVDTMLALRIAQSGAVLLLASFLLLPLMLWAGIGDWPLVIGTYVIVGFLAFHATWQVRQRKLTPAVPLVVGGVLAFALGRYLGSIVIVPPYICVLVIGIGWLPKLSDHRWLMVGSALAMLLVPPALEALGVISSTWSVEHGRLVSQSRVFDLSGAPGMILLLGINVLLVAGAAWFGTSVSRSRRDVQRQLEIHAWHLRHLLPDEAEHSMRMSVDAL